MTQYLKKDCELGYVEDNAEIDYLKFNNLRHTVLGCMLGDFDDEGNYIVSSNIRKELIQMKKYIVETMDNIEICLSELKLDRQISFMVAFEGNRATLSLIEKMSYEANFKINSGAYSNINEYLLDEVETSGEVNRNAIYQRWNIGEFGGNVLDIFSCDEVLLEKYFGIVNRFKYLLQANKILLDKEEQVEEIEAEYSNCCFELLKQFPEMKKAVEKNLKDSIETKRELLNPKNPNFAKTFNEILDNALEANYGILTDQQKSDYDYQMHNIRVATNLKKKEALDIAMSVINADIAFVANSEEQDAKQRTTTILTLHTGNIEEYKTVQECGEDFSESHRKYRENKASKQVDSKSEMGMFFSRLYAMGVLEQEKKQEVKQEQQVSTIVPTVENGAKSPAKAPMRTSVGDKKTPVKSKGGTGGKSATKTAPKKKGANLVQKAGQRETVVGTSTNGINESKRKRRVVVGVGSLSQSQTNIQVDDRKQVAPSHKANVLTNGGVVDLYDTRIPKKESSFNAVVSTVEIHTEEIHSL